MAETITIKEIEACILTGRDAGCPRDQVERLLNAGYIPLPWQWEFHAAARSADRGSGPVDIGCGGARGPGKALAIETLIPTPEGFIKMGDIKSGDKVYAPDGSITTVTGVSGIQMDRKCYTVLFSDGSSIVADAEHLWPTFTKRERVAFVRRSDVFRERRRNQRGGIATAHLVGLNIKSSPKVNSHTTEEIKNSLYIKNEVNHSIEVACPIIAENTYLPIDPYLLGVWLGDGHKDSGKITCFDEQIIDEICSRGYSAYRLKAEGLWRIETLTALLSNFERPLLNDKYIPSQYLRASIDQRIELLCGLNDTDGYVDKDGAIEFTNTNRAIAESYYELACSLGLKVTIAESNATLYGKIISRKWRIRYTAPFPVFRLLRKKDHQNINGTPITRRRFIVEIRDHQSVPVQCITVNHPSHCFLAGRSFIPTHNSHAVLSQAALDDCQRIDGLKGLFLRQTGVSARESFDDLVDKVVVGHVKMERTQNTLRFPNGSRILLGGFRTESDIDKYTGIEYDFIIVEELNQLTEEKYKKLRGSLRTSKQNWRPRMYTSFNPGGIGHAFVRSRYVIPQREGKQVETCFIGGTYKMNPYLNPEYTEYLEGLDGNLGKAWREGDFDLFEGMYFTEWRYEKHIEEPFVIPGTWFRYRSIDPSGREGVTSCHWYAVDANGRVHVYREYYMTGRDIDEHAKAIDALSRDEDGVSEDYQYTIIDAAAMSNQGYSETAAEIFERNGVTGLIPAAKERVIGWNAVHTYLRWTAEAPKPLICVFKTCTNLIRTIPLAQHDDHKPEDVASVGTPFTDKDGRQGTEHQDALDELRYLLRTLREVKAPKAQSLVERKLSELRNRESNQGFDYRYSR